VAKYSEFWSLNISRVHPHVPSLTTPPPSPHNRVQNKHGLHRCRVLYLCAVQRVLKTHWDSRRLYWTRLGRCEHPLTLESDWTGLDSTRVCWCVRTLTLHVSRVSENCVSSLFSDLYFENCDWALTCHKCFSL
jgi:hypothetical protein